MRIKNEYKFEYNVGQDRNGIDMVVCVATIVHLDRRIGEIRSFASEASCLSCGGYTLFPITDEGTKFIGKCKLKNGDVSNVDFAKSIARSKALRQANAVMANYLHDAESTIHKALDVLCALEDGTRDNSDKYALEIYHATRK